LIIKSSAIRAKLRQYALPRTSIYRAFAFFIALQVVKQAWLNKRGHMMKGYRQKRRYFVLTRSGYLHYFPNKLVFALAALNCTSCLMRSSAGGEPSVVHY
jgi:hypothetical protein